MPNITDWLMVGITAVYVIATILICWANLQSAKAAKAQLEEMKKQFEEENRPNIEAELLYERRMWFVVRFVNHGRKTAKHVKIELEEEFIDSLPEEQIKSLLLKQDKKECIIGVGQHYDLYIGSNALRGYPNIKPFSGIVRYGDESHSYEETVFIDLENYMTVFTSNTDHDDYMKAIRKMSEELKGIKQAVKKLQKQNDNQL